jgi:hypothetical protein
MTGPIVYVDHSVAAPGRLEELKRRISELADLVEEQEPDLPSYAVFFDEERGTMTVIHVHSDSATLATHFEVAGSAFARFADLVELQSIDVYGRPDDAVLERIRAKAALLGTGSVTIHERHAGFVRGVPSDVREAVD